MENKTTLIDRMIELGCDIHAKNKERYTTLHLSSMYSREDTIRLLLSKKADPNLPGGVRFLYQNIWNWNKVRISVIHTVITALSNHIWCICFTQPKNQSAVHLVCSRPTSHALQILRALLAVTPRSIRTNPDVVSHIFKRTCRHILSFTLS